jgi:oligopeptidase A
MTLRTATLRAMSALPLPNFADISAPDLQAAMETALDEAQNALTRLLATPAPDASALLNLEQLVVDLEQAWSPLRHLHSVADSPAVRGAYEACLPKITALYTELGQNPELFTLLEQLQASAITAADPALNAALEQRLRDMRLTGAALDANARAEVAALKTRLAKLQSQFSTNVLDASQRWHAHITDPQQLHGLPQSTLATAAAAATAESLEGWKLSLDAPVYLAVVQHAHSRSLRERLYTAWVTRASALFETAPGFDNTALMHEILELRHSLAQKLGFQTFAHYSLATKMASTPEQVIEFLQDLAARAKPVAERELATLREFALERDGLTDIEAWDIAFYAERLRESTLGLDQQALRPFFPMAQVLKGLFDVLQRLLGITVTEQPAASAWHPDVRQLALHDAHGKARGFILLDPYARAGKRGGAWMDKCRARHQLAGKPQLPVAYLTCNFAPPAKGTDAQLTHDEVITLFHETGHGIHHLLTDIDIPSVGGINGVAWDAVELPSQLLENWCWAPAAVRELTAHVDTGATLDDATIGQLRDSRTFLAGMAFVRQLEFALFDMQLHLHYPCGFSADATSPGAYVKATLADARAAVAVVPTPSFNRFANAFTHVFAGGYAAGYYSYKWAEVLASDAFAVFEEAGLFDAKAGTSFRDNFLARGGTEPADILYARFRGRAPDSAALLRHNGL